MTLLLSVISFCGGALIGYGAVQRLPKVAILGAVVWAACFALSFVGGAT